MQIITKPLAAGPALAGSAPSSDRTSKISRQGPQKLLLGGFMTMFLGFATVITGGTMMQDVRLLGTGMLLVLAGLGLLGLANLWRPSRAPSDINQLPEALLQSQPSTSLSQEENLQQVPSITERTTSLLQYPAAIKSTHPGD